jgi:DNA-binding IscR family transcriptional regulator
MFWLFYSWAIVLFGMQYTYGHQEVLNQLLQKPALELSQALREELALRFILEAAQRFKEGRPPLQTEKMANQLGISTELLRNTLKPLEEQGLIISTLQEDGTQGYVPGRSLQSLPLSAAVEALYYHGDPCDFDRDRDQILGQIRHVLKEAEASRREMIDQSVLKDLLVQGVS